MAAVLSESVLDQMVKTIILAKMTLFRTEFWYSRDQNVPFWLEEVYFGPFRSILTTLTEELGAGKVSHSAADQGVGMLPSLPSSTLVSLSLSLSLLSPSCCCCFLLLLRLDHLYDRAPYPGGSFVSGSQVGVKRPKESWEKHTF